MSFDSATFGASVLGTCLTRELSLRDAAEKTGVSVSTLSRITRGEGPDIHTFARLVRWMDVDANVFIQPSNNPVLADQDQYMKVYVDLLELRVPHDITRAVLTILRVVKERS